MTGNEPHVVLQKVLLLERDQGFQNRAAAGGLTRFVEALAVRADAIPVVEAAARELSGYDVGGAGERRTLVAKILALLNSEQPGPSTKRGVRPGPPRSRPVPAAELPRRPAGNVGSQTGVPVQSPTTIRVDRPPTGIVEARPRRASALATRLNRLEIDSPLAEVPGLRADTRSALEQLGVTTVRALLFYFPRDHYDYRDRRRISGLRYGEKTTLVATVREVQNQYRRRGLTLTNVVVADDSGTIAVRWFNQPYLAKQMKPGREIAITGQTELFNGHPVFVPKDYEWVETEDLIHGGRLVPIYPLRKGLYQKSLRSLIRRVVTMVGPKVPDHLPEGTRAECDLMSLPQAIQTYHFPSSDENRLAARDRLAFDELFAIQLGLARRKHEWQDRASSLPLLVPDARIDEFADGLPFALTRAQSRVMDNLRADLGGLRPMSRLLQGDVGSGKTVVAAFALFLAAEAGAQSVLMAPTEIVAEQHAATLSTILEPFGHRVGLLTGSSTPRARKEMYAALTNAEVQVAVGTHALIQEPVEFARLGLAVIDEQHRFGVGQRAALRQKGHNPHVLAMTATPIPRTLALTVYGDLDISVLDELPPGRQPVLTEWVTTPIRAYSRVREEVVAGRQAFVICPVIDESADADMKSAVAEHAYLRTTVFSDLRVALLHGRLPAKEKDRIMREFRAGAYQVLVATSVVEVGIDIPNATVMVIRDAHRFGLAQLHQFRGRIGRGGGKSHCLLVSDVGEGPARERLTTVVRTEDGFALAEEDLRLRGPGEFWGTRQSGLPELRVAQLSDVRTIERARTAAMAIAAADPDLSASEHSALRDEVARFWSQGADLS